MGREIKRVAMDFNFPLGDSWHDTRYDEHIASCPNVEHDDCWQGHGEPPAGEGWQLWQTVSDGPISPVFATADELIDWMCQPVPVEKRRRDGGAAFPSVPWDQGWRREVAEPFVKRCGWAPSFVMVGNRTMSGPEFVVATRDEEPKP